VKRVTAVAIVLCTAACTASGLPQPSFYASYDGGLDADSAGGSATGEVVGEPVLVQRLG